MGRAARGVWTELGPQENVTPATPRLGTAKGIGSHGETAVVIRSVEGLQGPGVRDELHDRFLRA